jgi:hypothetical protein
MVLLCLLPACLWGGQLVPIDCNQTNYAECALADLPGVEVASLGFSGLSVYAQSGPVRQAFEMSQSLDFTAPDGWVVTQITVFGRIDYSGYFASSGAWFTGPCGSYFYSSTFASCGMFPGVKSGTITGFVSATGDAMPPGAMQIDSAWASLGEVVLTMAPVSVPEPGTGWLMLAVLIASSLAAVRGDYRGKGGAGRSIAWKPRRLQ